MVANDRTDSHFIRRFRNSGLWAKTRKAYRREHPFCEECLRNGRRRAMVHVDHIVPLHLGGAFIEWVNLQSLCLPCHEAKSARENPRRKKRDPRGKRFENRRSPKPKNLLGFDLDGTAAPFVGRGP